MRKYLKQGFVLCMALMLALGAMSAAFAKTTPTEAKGSFEVTGYEVKNAGTNNVNTQRGNLTSIRLT